MAGPYYVDYVNGNDASNGLGPDASAVTNKPWKTLAKLLGAAGMASGEQAYLAPGAFRETVTVAMTSATVETKVTGDPANAKGFKTSGGVLVPPGEVRWTNYTTNDTTAGSGSCLTLAGRDFLTFENILFLQGTASNPIVNAATSVSTDIKFADCGLVTMGSGGGVITYTSAAGVAANWTLDRCVVAMLGRSNPGIDITATVHSSEYNLNILFQNCLFKGGSGAVTVRQGSTSSPGGGITFQCCTIDADIALTTTGTNVPATYKIYVYGCILFGQTALNAATSGQIVEDYNNIYAVTPRSNVTAGGNSVSSGARAPMLDFGQWSKFGQLPKPFMQPTPGSPLLGFGSTGSPPSVDFLNRPRPAGGASASYACGYLERHNSGIAGGAANADGASGNCIQQTGPADQDLYIPVDATSTTITIKQKTASYNGTNYPQIELLANASIGVTGQTVTDSAANTSYTTLSLAAITPTAKGVVTLRLKNRTGDGAGIVYWDTLSVT